MEKRRKLITFVSIIVSGFILDMGTKLWAQKALVPEIVNRKTQSMFSFNLTLAYNKGAAFGMFNSTSGGRWILTIVGIAALGFIYYLYTRPEAKSPLFLVGLALVGGGALGNLIDRIIFGKVTDFIQFWGTPSIRTTWPWPTFNIADIILVIGVGLMLIYSFTAEIPEKGKKKKKKKRIAKKAKKDIIK